VLRFDMLIKALRHEYTHRFDTAEKAWRQNHIAQGFAINAQLRIAIAEV
jgi:hypothetical protein